MIDPPAYVMHLVAKSVSECGPDGRYPFHRPLSNQTYRVPLFRIVQHPIHCGVETQVAMGVEPLLHFVSSDECDYEDCCCDADREARTEAGAPSPQEPGRGGNHQENEGGSRKVPIRYPGTAQATNSSGGHLVNSVDNGHDGGGGE
jgi:hypothetical protein